MAPGHCRSDASEFILAGVSDRSSFLGLIHLVSRPTDSSLFCAASFRSGLRPRWEGAELEGPYEKRRDATIRRLFLDPRLFAFLKWLQGREIKRGGGEEGGFGWTSGMILEYCAAIYPSGWTVEFISYLQRCLDNSSITAAHQGEQGERGEGGSCAEATPAALSDWCYC